MKKIHLKSYFENLQFRGPFLTYKKDTFAFNFKGNRQVKAT